MSGITFLIQLSAKKLTCIFPKGLCDMLNCLKHEIRNRSLVWQPISNSQSTVKAVFPFDWWKQRVVPVINYFKYKSFAWKIRIFYYIYQEAEDPYPIIECWMSESFGMNRKESDQTFPRCGRNDWRMMRRGNICVCISVFVEKVVGVKPEGKWRDWGESETMGKQEGAREQKLSGRE